MARFLVLSPYGPVWVDEANLDAALEKWNLTDESEPLWPDEIGDSGEPDCRQHNEKP